MLCSYGCCVVDKLQCEMLRQDLENEDELLLALAGLKQVSFTLHNQYIRQLQLK